MSVEEQPRMNTYGIYSPFLSCIHSFSQQRHSTPSTHSPPPPSTTPTRNIEIAQGIPVYEGIGLNEYGLKVNGIYIPSYIGTDLPMNNSTNIISNIYMDDENNIQYSERSSNRSMNNQLIY